MRGRGPSRGVRRSIPCAGLYRGALASRPAQAHCASPTVVVATFFGRASIETVPDDLAERDPLVVRTPPKGCASWYRVQLANEVCDKAALHHESPPCTDPV